MPPDAKERRSWFLPPGTQPVQVRDEAIAIVDPYTSGRFLVDELCQRGWPLVAVRSSLDINEVLLGSWNPAPFERVVVHKGDLDETASAVKNGRPTRAVIAGSDPGVGLADALSERLGLRTNGSELSRCRTDKFHMHERLRGSGLRACAQRRCSSVADALDFAASLGRWPLIAKPCASYGSCGVFQCEDLDALTEAVGLILDSKSIAGHANDAVLVQEFLEGQEYVVDCVSLEGRHLVSATWAYKKTNVGGSFVYDHTKTLPYSCDEGSVQQTLYNYVFGCLTVLGIRNGASHSEVIVLPSGEPCLVETGARMHGSVGPGLWAECAGREQGQAFLVADVYAEDGKELSRKLEAVAAGGPAYDLEYSSVQVDLQCHQGGVLAESIEMAAGAWLRDLPTFWMSKFFVEVGDRVQPTRDMFTSPGYVILLGEEAADVERDAEAIRERERSGRMYKFEPETLGEANGAGNEEDGDMMTRRGSLVALKGSIKDAYSMKGREMDSQADHLLSPFVSRASSPVLSPQQAPYLPPDIGELVEFTLDGAEGLDDLDGFSLDGPAGLPPAHGLDDLEGFSLDGPAK